MYKTAAEMTHKEFKEELEKMNDKLINFARNMSPSRQNRTYLKAELRKMKVAK